MGNDPCDQMVTVKQVLHHVLWRHTFEQGDPYTVAGLMLGLPRDEAKRTLYMEMYRG